MLLLTVLTNVDMRVKSVQSENFDSVGIKKFLLLHVLINIIFYLKIHFKTVIAQAFSQ